MADSLLYDERCHLPRTAAGPSFEEDTGQEETEQVVAVAARHQETERPYGVVVLEGTAAGRQQQQQGEAGSSGQQQQ